MNPSRCRWCGCPHAAHNAPLSALESGGRGADALAMDTDEKWCNDCGRIKGVGCSCGLTFAEKLRTVQIDRESLH